MISFFKQLFVWWHRQTIGTFVYTLFSGKFIGADKLFYQNLDDLISSVKGDNSSIQKFDASCFDGQYVTEDVTQDYLKELDNVRNDASKQNQPIDISEDVIVY